MPPLFFDEWKLTLAQDGTNIALCLKVQSFSLMVELDFGHTRPEDDAFYWSVYQKGKTIARGEDRNALDAMCLAEQALGNYIAKSAMELGKKA